IQQSKSKELSRKLEKAQSRRKLAIDSLKISTVADIYLSNLEADYSKDYEDVLICSICKTGYRFKPINALSLLVYTFKISAESPPSSFDVDSPHCSILSLTAGVSVHNKCLEHHSRSLDIVLINAYVSWNNTLPIWSGDDTEKPESKNKTLFKQSVNSYTEKIVQILNIGNSAEDSLVWILAHDVKNLLLKIACKQSLSEHTQGGGLSSNISIIPYQILLVIYSLSKLNKLNDVRIWFDKADKYPLSHWLSSDSLKAEQGAHFLALMKLILLPSASTWFENDHRARCILQLISVTVAQFARDHNMSSNNLEAQRTLLDNFPEHSSLFISPLIYFSMIDHFFRFLQEIQSNMDLMISETSLMHLWITIRTRQTLLKKTCDKLCEFVEDIYSCINIDELWRRVKPFSNEEYPTIVNAIQSIINQNILLS
ncbi:hypothetical protein GJ496_000412, partial [Pomphorhynchus laevis]